MPYKMAAFFYQKILGLCLVEVDAVVLKSLTLYFTEENCHCKTFVTDLEAGTTEKTLLQEHFVSVLPPWANGKKEIKTFFAYETQT